MQKQLLSLKYTVSQKSLASNGITGNCTQEIPTKENEISYVYKLQICAHEISRVVVSFFRDDDQVMLYDECMDHTCTFNFNESILEKAKQFNYNKINVICKLTGDLECQDDRCFIGICTEKYTP